MPLRAHLGLLLLAGAVVAGCGSGSSAVSPTDAASNVSAMPAGFPAAGGRTMRQLRAGVPQGPVLEPGPAALVPGREWVGFALRDSTGRPVAGAPVALYLARADGTGLRGPYGGRRASHGAYVARVRVGTGGRVVMLAFARLDGRLVATAPRLVRVRPRAG